MYIFVMLLLDKLIRITQEIKVTKSNFTIQLTAHITISTSLMYGKIHLIPTF